MGRGQNIFSFTGFIGTELGGFLPWASCPVLTPGVFSVVLWPFDALRPL